MGKKNRKSDSMKQKETLKKNNKLKFTDAEQAKFDLQKKMVDKIYTLSHDLYNAMAERGDASEYYRYLLQSIYIKTGKKSRHNFSGIVTQIKSTNNKTQIYLMNVYWYKVYVSHHIVIKIDSNIKLPNIRQGDFVKFSSLIEEYNDGTNFGLFDFKPISKIEIKKCKKLQFNTCVRGLTVKKTDLDIYIGRLSYEKKIDLYYSLTERLTSIGRLINDIPYNSFNTMIHGVYFRQMREHDLYNQLNIITPYDWDLDNLILIQLWVLWIIEVKKILHPGYVLLPTMQFVIDNTYKDLSMISYGLKKERKHLQRIDDKIFKPILDGMIYYGPENIREYLDHWIYYDPIIFDDLDVEEL